ncbi:MAG: PQQ-binding-like beta-propeller repeat protein, partial [Planctomycetes bacterium]|nr:PQQ-binding-like beta-propeller repeat protein [Planctomycetota bacterium]
MSELPTNPAAPIPAAASPDAAAGSPTAAPASAPRMRVWPAVLIIAGLWATKILPGWLIPGTIASFMVSMWGPMFMTIVFLLWWIFASRLPWKERFLVLGACLATAAVAIYAYHPSMKEMGGMSISIGVVPLVVSFWGAWLLCTLLVSWPIRRAGLFVLFALVWGYFALVRLDGIDGAFQSTMNFRWNPTPEELYLKQASSAQPVATPVEESSEVLTLDAEDWPGFRGAERDGVRSGIQIDTDWSSHPPRELWRKRVGPGWSSFAVVGTRVYTQEQRGEVEVVVCYDAATGKELWKHSDKVRFEEAIAGPGPRATPTFAEGRIYAQGASGLLNCLDAVTGRQIWTADIEHDSGAKRPTWGYSASPHVAAGIVSIYAGGPNKKSVLGYDAETGELKWSNGEGEFGYCSTQLSRIEGVDQLLVSTDQGVSSFAPADGKLLWHFDSRLEGGMARVVQPAVVGGTDVLIGTGFGNGTRRFHVSQEQGEWQTKEVWWNQTFSPYYNDFVIHQNFLYGFNNNFFVCVNLDDGKMKWKARGYGNGEVLLLAEQG